MKKTGIINKVIITAAIAAGTVIMASEGDAQAAVTPKLNTTSKTLTISVKEGGNSYAKTTLKIKNKKKLTIKKVSYSTKNAIVAKVSKKGVVTAQSPGRTTITAMIKYKNKSKSKLKKKKINVKLVL